MSSGPCTLDLDAPCLTPCHVADAAADCDMAVACWLGGHSVPCFLSFCFRCRYAGILSALGIHMADVVKEAQVRGKHRPSTTTMPLAASLTLSSRVALFILLPVA